MNFRIIFFCFLCFISILKAENLLFNIGTNYEDKTKIIQSIDEYKQILQKKGQEAIKRELTKKIKEINVLLDKKDFDKIYNQTKQRIEQEITKNINNIQKMIIENGFTFDSLGINVLNVENYVNNLSIKNITTQLNSQLKNTIMDNLGFSIGGLFGKCCCSSFINSQIKSLLNYVIPKIKAEIELIDKITNKFNQITKRDDKLRFNNGVSWQDGIYGKNIDSELTQIFYLNQITKQNTLNKQLIFLNNKIIANLKKSEILNKKINLLLHKIKNNKEN